MLALASRPVARRARGEGARPGGATRGRRAPLPRGRADARQRAPRHPRPDRVPGPRLGPGLDPGRIAQRGGARPVGVRPPLRAPDVPRHARVPGGAVPGRHHADGRPAERVHRGRPHELPRDVPQGGARAGARARGGPVHEPRRRRRAVQDGDARGPRGVRQERVEPVHEARGGPARRRVPDAPVQAHDDGVPRRRRGHAQPARARAPLPRALVSPRARDADRRGRPLPGEGAAARGADLRPLEARRAAPDRGPPRAAARRARPRARRLGDPDAALGDGRLPRAGVLGPLPRLGRGEPPPRARLRRDLRAVPAPRRGGAGRRPAGGGRDAHGRPRPLHRLGAAEAARGRGPGARRDPPDPRAGAGGAARRGEARGSRSRPRATRSSGRSTRPRPSRTRSRATRCSTDRTGPCAGSTARSRR